MNPQGAIATFETDADAQKAGYNTLLSDEETRVLLPLNRHERRKRLAEMRRTARKAARKSTKPGSET